MCLPPHISYANFATENVTHFMFYETGVLRWGRSCRSELFTCLSGAASRSALLLIAQRTPDAVHDNSPGATRPKRSSVSSVIIWSQTLSSSTSIPLLVNEYTGHLFTVAS